MMNHLLLISVAGLALMPGCTSTPSRPADAPASAPIASPMARPPDPAAASTSRREAFLAAVDRSPLVAATRGRLHAAQARVGAAGVLPDPVISAEARRMREERTDGVELWLEQELPRWGERAAERSMVRSEVAMASAELAEARGMAAAGIATAIARACAARGRATLQDEEVARMRVLLDRVTATLAADGGATATDALALRSRIDSAEVMATDLRRMAIDAEEEAGATIGLKPGDSLPELVLPEQDEVAVVDYAPGRMAQARVAEAEAREAMARSRGKPMVGVGVGWEREDLDMPHDGVMAMIEVGIPLYRDAYRADVRAAQASGLAARRQIEAERLKAEVLLRRAQRAQRQAEQAGRVADEISMRVDAEIEALRGQMAAGGGAMGGRDILMRLFDRLDARNGSRAAAIEARLEADEMTAELWRFIPLADPDR